jgi:hypothetical protein
LTATERQVEAADVVGADFGVVRDIVPSIMVMSQLPFTLEPF